MYPTAMEKIWKVLWDGNYKNTNLFAQLRSYNREVVSWKVPSVGKENSKIISSNLKEVFSYSLGRSVFFLMFLVNFFLQVNINAGG